MIFSRKSKNNSVRHSAFSLNIGNNCIENLQKLTTFGLNIEFVILLEISSKYNIEPENVLNAYESMKYYVIIKNYKPLYAMLNIFKYL